MYLEAQLSLSLVDFNQWDSNLVFCSETECLQVLLLSTGLSVPHTVLHIRQSLSPSVPMLYCNSEADLSFSLPVSVSSHFLDILHSLAPFSHYLRLTLSFLRAAAAGCPGLRGPGGGSGVQGPRRPSSARQMVPPGRGDPGLP